MGEGRAELQRVLGFRDVLFIAVGQIIGAGVIALTGVAIGMTGPSVVFAYLGAAVLVLVTTALIMMAGATLPTTGAYYTWTSRLLGGWLGSITLFLILLSSVSLSLYGSSFGLYLSPLLPQLSVNGWGVLILCVLFLTNLLGLQLASKLQLVMVLCLLFSLALYTGFAVPRLDTDLLTPMFPEGMVGFVTAIFLLKFATSGAYLIVGLGDEMKDPRRTIPRVIVSATVGVALLYSLVALASVGVVPWQDMVNQPLTVAGREFMPGWALNTFLVLGAGLAVGTTMNSQFIQLPRIFMMASWDDVLPRWCSSLNRFGAPWVILLAMLLIGVVPLLAGLDIGAIARAATITASLPAFFVYWAIYRIPEAFPQAYADSGFRIGAGLRRLLLVLSMLSTAVGVLFLARDLDAAVVGIMLGWFALSVLYYPLRRRALARRDIDLDAKASDRSVFAAT